MLDIRKIRENPDFYRERLARRNTGDEKLISHLLVLDEKRRKHLQESEALKSERNRASKEIGATRNSSASKPSRPISSCASPTSTTTPCPSARRPRTTASSA